MQLPRVSRRQFLASLGTGAGVALTTPSLLAGTPEPVLRSQPVILATDIGDDIDDTWALGLLLKSPELDLKLVVGEYGKREYRAKLLAKLLQAMGHPKVPIGLGLDGEPHGDGPQADWIKDYQLSSYPGKIHQDGVQAIIDAVMKSREPVTIISIGPMPNVAAALEREPRIAERARLVGMYGSVRKGYDGTKKPSAEWNVKADVKSCQKGLSAPWDVTITPLDTCGFVRLDGDHYRRVFESRDRIAATIIENYKIWSKANKNTEEVVRKQSSTLFDTVAVYLAYSQNFCTMERLNIRVNDDGFTVIDDKGKPMQVATDWKSLSGYCEFMANRLTS